MGSLIRSTNRKRGFSHLFIWLCHDLRVASAETVLPVRAPAAADLDLCHAVNALVGRGGDDATVLQVFLSQFVVQTEEVGETPKQKRIHFYLGSLKGDLLNLFL